MALEQEGFRWRADNGPEEGSPGASYLAAQDTNGVSIGLDTAIRLRVLVNAAGLAPATQKYRLEARKVESPTGQWFEVEAVGSPGGNPKIRLKASSNITAGGENTTAQLTPPSGSPKSFTAGRIWDDESGQDDVAISNDQYTELEFCIEAVSANGAQSGDVYEFRVTRKPSTAAGGGGISAGVGPVEGLAAGGTTTITANLSGTTSGRTIVVGALWFPDTVTFDSVDISGQAGTVHAASLASSGNLQARSQFATLTSLSSGGDKTITATFSGNIGASEGIIIVWEFAGSNGFDAGNGAIGNSAAASLTLTPVADDCHIIAITQNNSNGTFSAGSGYTITVMSAAAYFNRAEQDTDFNCGVGGVGKTVDFSNPSDFWSISAISLKKA